MQVREDLTVLTGPKSSPGGEHRERGARGPPGRKSVLCLARETGADSISWVRVEDETFTPQAKEFASCPTTQQMRANEVFGQSHLFKFALSLKVEPL